MGRLLPNPLRYSQRKSVESIHLYSWGMTVHINRPQGVQGRRDLVVLYAKVVKAVANGLHADALKGVNERAKRVREEVACVQNVPIITEISKAPSSMLV